MSDAGDDDQVEERGPPFVTPTGRTVEVLSIFEIYDAYHETGTAEIEVRGRQSTDPFDAGVVIEITDGDGEVRTHISLEHFTEARHLAQAIEDAAEYAEKKDDE